MQKSTAILLLIFASSLAVFFQSISYYFFQDDWFVLKTVKEVSWLQIPSLFNFRTDIIYWRPVGMQMFFFLSNKLFGVNPLLFHLFAFTIHALNIYLIYRLARNIMSDQKAALISAFLYATSSFHFMTLSWLSLTWNLFGLTFSLLCAISVTSGKKVMAFIFFLLALSSTEFAVLLPALLVGLNLITEKSINIKRIISKSFYLLPYVATLAVYATLRFVAYPIPASGAYQISIGLNVAKEYLWYVLWFLNMPELLRYHLTLSNFKINKDFADPAGSLLIPLLVLFAAQVAIVIFVLFKSKSRTTYMLSALAAGLFMLLLLPVVVLKDHSYPYYLTLASTAPILFLGYLFKKQGSRLTVIFLALWFALSMVSTRINVKTHWITGEQAISRKVVTKALQEHPSLEGSQVLFISPSSKQIELSLLDQYALRVVYNNEGIVTKFQRAEDEKPASGELPVLWTK